MTPDIYCIFCRSPETRARSIPFGGVTRKCRCGEYLVRPPVAAIDPPAQKASLAYGPVIQATCSECPTVFPTRSLAPRKTCSPNCAKARDRRSKRAGRAAKMALPHVRPHLQIARTGHPVEISVGVKRYGGVSE